MQISQNFGDFPDFADVAMHTPYMAGLGMLFNFNAPAMDRRGYVSSEVIRIGPKISNPEPICPAFRFWGD
jgi:hypothetical protein